MIFEIQGAEMVRLFNFRHSGDKNTQANTSLNHREKAFKYRSHLFSTTVALVSLCYSQRNIPTEEDLLKPQIAAFRV